MENGLRTHVAGGMVWSLAEKGGSMLLQAGVGILIARLLAPEDYGVMAILSVFVTLSLVTVDSGFSQTLIRSSEPTEADFRAVFSFNLAASAVLYGLMIALAPLLARFFDQPLLTEIAPVLFLLLPLNALCVIQQALCTRNFRFDTLSKALFLSTAASGVVAIGMAWAGCGVWSLVGQRLTAMGVKAGLLWTMNDWRPRGRFDGARLRAMAPYSLRLLATDWISALYNNIAQLFVGKIYSARTLGFFNQGQKLKDQPVTALTQSVQHVTFPALSKIKDDPAKFAESYRQLTMTIAFAVFPVMAGLIATAPELFALLLGEKWMPTVPYFEILCLSGLFMPLAMIAYNVLKARSDGRAIVRLEVVKKGIMTGILALTIPLGVTAIAWGIAAMAACEWLLNAVAAARYTELPARRLAAALAPAALLTAVMYGVVTGVATLLPDTLLLRLAVEIAAGVAVYLGGAWLLRFEALRIARELWHDMRRKQ